VPNPTGIPAAGPNQGTAQVSEIVDRLTLALGDRYAIEAECGRGGMATVYRARDLRHERLVAVKVLRPELILVADRFKREIKLAAGLRHPHILPVHDSGNAEGLLYYVMPFVEGETLRQRIDRLGRLSIDDILEITTEVADALSYAHRQGIVHRDIKPANILLEERHAIVADFGVALAIGAEDKEKITGTGLSIGTPTYMSPEQIEAVSHVDGRADTYGLACIVFEMLTGQPPFSGPTPLAILSKRFTQPVPSVTSFRDDVPADVDAVLSQGLALEPDQRPRTANEFAAALRKAIQQPTISTRERIRRAPGPSIAVLPFANLSADPENEYFSDGITEDVINALSKISALRVASRTSAFVFKGASEDIRSIGRQLNVTTLLEGSVRRAGTRLRVTAQLIDVRTGYHLWSEQYDREMHDVFAIQDEISRAIVGTLKVKLVQSSDEHLVTRHTDNIEAYNLYLKGRYFWNLRGAGLNRAADYFRKAIDEDPEFALAHSALADTKSLFGWYRAVPPKEAFPKAKAQALEAIKLDDDLAEGHTSLAFVLMMHDWAWEDAEREFIRALDLNPGYPTAHHWYAEFLMVMGRIEEAISHSKRAVELDPLGLIVHVLLGMAYHFARRNDEAVDELTKVLEMEPAYQPAFIWLGQAYLQLGQYVEAVETFKTEVELSPQRSTTRAYLAAAHAFAGEEDEARRLLGDLEARSAGGYVSAFDFAMVYFALEEDDVGFEWMNKAVEERAPWLTWLAVDPMFDRVREDPRFVALLEELKLA